MIEFLFWERGLKQDCVKCDADVEALTIRMWSKHEPGVMMSVPIQEVVLLQSRNSPFQCTNKVEPEVRMVGRTFSALLTTALESLTSWLASFMKEMAWLAVELRGKVFLFQCL